MPVISITLLPGYSAEAEERLVGRVALAARSVIAAAAAGTTVFVNHAQTYQRDGRVFSKGGPECANASDMVRHFLALMQDRDLTAASAMLTPDFVMKFPGHAPMHALSEMVTRAKGRYASVAKDYEHFDESWGDGFTVVYCSGTLRGVWLDGTSFEGVRFIDRFEIADGKIRRQDVWNDLAEAQPPRQT
jgi:ketosteroid isomerase-like protein/phenylpyruvate tautomerase PptA (4-oxalocrotonate tautomerase family)